MKPIYGPGAFTPGHPSPSSGGIPSGYPGPPTRKSDKGVQPMAPAGTTPEQAVGGAKRGKGRFQPGSILAGLRNLVIGQPQLHENVTPLPHDLNPERWQRQSDDLNYGPIANRIPQLHRPGLTLMAGPSAFSTDQQDYRAFIPPPLVPTINRGARSVSGVTQRVVGADTIHIPAIFVPKDVR